MKNTLKALSAFLAVLFTFISLPICRSALPGPVGKISGESNRSYEKIRLSDGSWSGVRYTQMDLSGTYGSNKVLRIAECNLSDPHLSVDVINCGTYTVSRQTVSKAANAYSKDGKTVLAALNGDLWMTSVNSNSNVTKKTLCTTRGVMIIDREIWATQEFGMENYVNTSNAGTVAARKNAFGVTSSNQPLVGSPEFTVTVNNMTKKSEINSDGINRLPAWNSLVVYNNRINSSNYALDDSFEVELQTSSPAFMMGRTTTARVVAIYPSGSSIRPAIGSNTIILTARGNRMSDLASYSVGDVVSIKTTLVDKLGRTDMWQDVTDAIGGHMEVLVDGKDSFLSVSSSEYPTSLIGIKDDGTVMFCNASANTSGVYKGLRQSDAVKICRELGYNSVFYLDGGGSASMVTLKDGTCTLRNACSDGSERSVINAVAMVWNDEPVCEKQGTLGYIYTDNDLKGISPTHLSGGLLKRVSTRTAACYTDYIVKDKAFRLTTNAATADAYATLDLSGFDNRLNASEYPRLAIKLKTSAKVDTFVSLYFTTVSDTSFSETKRKMIAVSPGDDYTLYFVSMSDLSTWKGNINLIRFDILEGITSSPGETVDVEYIGFCKSASELTSYRNGDVPVGRVGDFYAYRDCAGNHMFTSCKASASGSGMHIRSCENCGYSVEEAHTFRTDYTVDTPPSYTQTGLKSRHCTLCDAVTDVTSIPQVELGDVNGDGDVGPHDSLQLKLYIVDKPNLALYPDVNCDGDVNSKDSLKLKRIIAGLD